MTAQSPDRFDRFREKARAEGIPADDVERWLATARPCARLDRVGEGGPVAGRLGSPVMLPADAPDPWCGLAATVDLAALPPEATDLPLPRQGHLLLFARPDPDSIGRRSLGSALHIPAGTPVEERQVDFDTEPGDGLYGVEFPQGQLRLRTGISMPEHSQVYASGPSGPTALFSDHHFTPEQHEAWEVALDTWGLMEDETDRIVRPGLQIGGYAVDEYGEEDPAVRAGREAARAQTRGELPEPATDVRPHDWVCLAQWWHGIEGLESALFSWSIARQDLAAGRFDRVYATMTYNP